MADNTENTATASGAEAAATNEQDFVPSNPNPQARVKAKSAGQPQPVTAEAPMTKGEPRTKDAPPEGGGSGDTPPNTNTKDTQTAQQPIVAASAFDATAISALLEEHGVKSLDELKAKLSGAPTQQAAPAELTEEEKKKQESVLDRRMLDLFLENGGTVESYAQLKNIAAADVSILAQNELRSELQEAGFKDAEIDTIIAERYSQIADEELDQFDDESDKDFAKRKNEYVKKKLLGRGERTQVKAKEYLDTLRNAVQSQDLLGTKEKEFSSKVDEFFQALPKQVSLKLGMINDQEVAPIVYDVSDNDIAEVADILKDPSKRQSYFFNEDNSLNLKNIAEIMLKAKYMDSLAKAAYLEGGTREVKTVENIFPMRSAGAVGVGGATTKPEGKKGKAASYGGAVVVNPQRR